MMQSKHSVNPSDCSLEWETCIWTQICTLSWNEGLRLLTVSADHMGAADLGNEGHGPGNSK